MTGTDIVTHVVEHGLDLALLDPALRAAGGLARDELLRLVGPAWGENLRRVRDRVGQKLKGKKTEPPPLSVSLPLLEEARNESRDELVEVWASLLATASDPARRNLYRREFVDIAKRLDPIDALMLPLVAQPGPFEPTKQEYMAQQLGRAVDEVVNSTRNMVALDLGRVETIHQKHSPMITALGRQFLSAVQG